VSLIVARRDSPGCLDNVIARPVTGSRTPGCQLAAEGAPR
jgi:hypothetical protein